MAHSTKPKNGNAPTPALSATNLKTALWETLQDIKGDRMQPAQGDAIAAQAREILRTVKVQLQVCAHTKRSVPVEVIEFADKPGT